jgi:hypothetical protein
VLKKQSFSPRSTLVEIASFLAYLLLLLWLLCAYAEFGLYRSELRMAALAVALSPAAMVYLLLRLLVGVAAAFAGGVGLAALLVGINHTKTAFTGMPLSWGDLATTQNVSIVLAYLSWWQIVLVVVAGLAVVLLVGLAIRHAQARATWFGRLATIGLLVVIAPVALQPYLPETPWNANYRVGALLEREGIAYSPGDWRGNVSANGLFVHLVQTSRRPVPAQLSDSEWAMLESIPEAPPVERRPQHIFFILCEACWHDGNNFQDAFEPMRRLGFLPLRGISPAYGGGTVNASFEMLTAMPSRGALTGVVYQEYGLVMSSKARTLASALKEKGYDTYALHNFTRTFWLRNIVLRKFGFDEFIGLEDMGYDGPGPFPKDKILYNRVLDILKKDADKKAFFNLETVYTHWPYPFKGDSGEGDYHRRLTKAIADLAKFVEAVREISPDAMFVVYGDHKPALTKFFYEKGVLPADMFAHTGADAEDFVFKRFLDQNVLGDVPVWVGGGSRDGEELKKMQRLADHKPFYCISAIFDQLFLDSQNPASRYAQHYICDAYDTDYLLSTAKMPAWIYSAMLFHPLQGE